MQPRLSAWAPLLDTRDIHHGLLLPILVHCVDERASDARTTKRGISPERPHRHPSGRRGHAPILDADPLRARWLIAATWMLMPVTMQRLLWQEVTPQTRHRRLPDH